MIKLAETIQFENKVDADTLNENEEYKRYIPVERSIIGSLLEVREMITGRLPKPTLEDFFSEIDDDIKTLKNSEG